MSSKKILMIINGEPGNMKAWNALRLAAGLVGVDLELKIFLLDNGVYLAKTGQKPVPGLAEFDCAKKLKDLMELGVEVKACITCIDMKGVGREELLDGVAVSNLMELAEVIRDSDQTLTF